MSTRDRFIYIICALIYLVAGLVIVTIVSGARTVSEMSPFHGYLAVVTAITSAILFARASSK